MRRETGRQSALFQAGWRAAEVAAAQVIAERWSVASMRAAGGWTGIIQTAFAKAVGDATVPGLFGHPLLVRSLLTSADVSEIRLAAQGQRHS